MNKNKLESLLCLADIKYEQIWELPNNYWPTTPEYYIIRAENPWWLVKTEYGFIKIGWRKRVIEISWEDTKFCGKITDDFHVTSEEKFCHAWSYAKAVEYLSTLKSRLVV